MDGGSETGVRINSGDHGPERGMGKKAHWLGGTSLGYAGDLGQGRLPGIYEGNPNWDSH